MLLSIDSDIWINIQYVFILNHYIQFIALYFG